MTDFSAFSGQAVSIYATLAAAQTLDVAYLKKNLGIVITVGVIYLALLLGLAIIRIRRTVESFAYLR